MTRVRAANLTHSKIDGQIFRQSKVAKNTRATAHDAAAGDQLKGLKVTRSQLLILKLQVYPIRGIGKNKNGLIDGA